MKNASILILAMLLGACGGGGTPSVPDNSAAINAALTNIAKNTPTVPAYTGAFTLIEGISSGYVSGTSDQDVAARLLAPIVADPVKYAPLYKLLTSDAGLKVTIVGETVGTSSINGLPLKNPDRVGIAKLLSTGLRITF
jgi:hypothetical protein